MRISLRAGVGHLPEHQKIRKTSGPLLLIGEVGGGIGYG